MATQPTKKFMNSYRQRNLTRSKIETRISPNDELECRQIYEKLEQLQPNGVCVNLDTLRRALYPPIPISKNKTDQILLLRTYHKHYDDKMPQIQLSNVSKSTKINKIDRLNFNQIINQVKKHAAINYSYYTRTK